MQLPPRFEEPKPNEIRRDEEAEDQDPEWPPYHTLDGAPERDFEPRQRFSLLAELARNLAHTTLMAVVPAGGAILVSMGIWVISGVPALQLARGELLAAEKGYHDALHHSQPVLDELDVMGAPVDQVQTIYFAFADADGDNARRMADTYLGVLSDQAALLREQHEDTRLPELLSPADRARQRTAATYRAWMERLSGPRGRLALVSGMVAGPTPGMAIYERSHPRR